MTPRAPSNAWFLIGPPGSPPNGILIEQGTAVCHTRTKVTKLPGGMPILVVSYTGIRNYFYT